MAILGIVAAQIHKIHDSLEPDPGHQVLGKPQAYVCHILAISVILVGAYRFFRQQTFLVDGRARLCN
jgi:hypothetical protein